MRHKKFNPRKYDLPCLKYALALTNATTMCFLIFVLATFILLSYFQTLKSQAFFRISGNSMYPALKGETWMVTCPRCTYLGQRPAAGMRICDNCQWLTAENTWTRLYRPLDPERVQLEIGRTPVFGDKVIVGTDKKKDGMVKRVWGLPGDEVKIHDGKVYVNGARPIRSLQTLREMRILVNNDGYRAKQNGEFFSRWRCDDGGWENPQPDAWRCAIPPLRGASTESAMFYTHYQGQAIQDADTGGTRMEYVRTPITNQRSTNGTQMRAEWTHPVNELMLCFYLQELCSGGVLGVILPSGRTEWEFFFFAAEKHVFQSFRAEKNCHFYVVHPGNSRRMPLVTVSTLDGVPRVWKDERLQEEIFPRGEASILPADLRMREGLPEDSPRIVCFGAGEAMISHIILYRDEYFLENSVQFAYPATKSLEKKPQKGYYLLGDNSYLSEDSRLWGPVPKEKIVGTVVHTIHGADRFEY